MHEVEILRDPVEKARPIWTKEQLRHIEYN